MVRCVSCGAEFDASEPKCPYCGTMYEPGAEAHYMNNLGDIREDMEDLGHLALSETASEMKQAFKKTAITVIVIIAVFAVIFGIYWLWDYIRWNYYLFW